MISMGINSETLATVTAVTSGSSNIGKLFYGRFNFHTMDFFPFTELDVMGGTCFVDYREIKNVWFADTEMGIVRTYDVLHDGSVATATASRPCEIDNRCEYLPSDFPGREVECPRYGALSETLRGRVQIFGA